MAKRKVKKSEKKKRDKQERQLKEQLYAFLKDYSDGEDPQATEMAATDREIQSFMTFLSDRISATPEGTLVDIGCGKGVLLARLADLPAFRKNESWIYLGTDLPEMAREVLDLAVETGVHRRADYVALEHFYTNWPDRHRFHGPHTVVLRNVLHELGVDETAHLLVHISKGLQPSELAIIQDLAVFPKAEKGHACWIPEDLHTLVSDCGFDVSITPERSSSGNRWFNLIATRNKNDSLGIESVRNEVLKKRTAQLDQWKNKGALLPDDEMFRDVQIAKIDFDLQFAALSLQLQNAGARIPQLSAAQESLVHNSTFMKHLRAFHLYIPERRRLAITISSHFRDRANSLSALINFFTSDHSVTLISGPPYMGKSELVHHFLCSEDFRQERLPVFVDLLTTSGGWNLLDQILSEMGCAVPNDVISSMKNVKLDDIRQQIQEFFYRHAPQIVVTVDHLERITEPSGVIADPEIKELLSTLAEGKGAKLILTSRRNDTNLSFLPSGRLHSTSQPVVGRFPRKDHVENVLRSFMLQAEYPNELLLAIDHHPFLAILTGMYLQQKGQSVFEDKEFLEDLRFKLRDAIFAKILTPEARPAIKAISGLRIPVPRDMVIALSSADSVRTAEEAGLIRPHLGGMRDDLVGCIGALRIATWDLDVEEVSLEKEEKEYSLSLKGEKQVHEQIASLYEQIYRKSDDPIWLREAHFHRMIYSTKEDLYIFGNRFRAELFAAGEYWYDHDKNFRGALWAYKRALEYGQTGYRIRMRIASCKLRIASSTEQEEEAREEFEMLIRSFPYEYGIKTAYIDAILHRKDYRGTIQLLQKLNLKNTDSWWVAGQYGRAYSGLHEHRKAIAAFERQIQEKPEAMAYEQIARAYHRLSDTENEHQKINQGLMKYPLNRH